MRELLRRPQIPASLKSSCTPRTPHAGLLVRASATTATRRRSGARPTSAASAASACRPSTTATRACRRRPPTRRRVPGADADGTSRSTSTSRCPTLPAPPGGYPLIVFMHGCCAGDKTPGRRPTSAPASAGTTTTPGSRRAATWSLNYTARGLPEPGGRPAAPRARPSSTRAATRSTTSSTSRAWSRTTRSST